MGTQVSQLLCDPSVKKALGDVLTDFGTHGTLGKSRMLSTAGLVIHGSASALAKSGGADAYYVASGALRKLASATDMAALSGSITHAKFNVYVFFVDSGGVLSSAMGTEGASLATIAWPDFPSGKTCIGFVIVNPTGTGPFVGGTTALDDATVAPNAVYVSLLGAFDPGIDLQLSA